MRMEDLKSEYFGLVLKFFNGMFDERWPEFDSADGALVEAWRDRVMARAAEAVSATEPAKAEAAMLAVASLTLVALGSAVKKRETERTGAAAEARPVPDAGASAETE